MEERDFVRDQRLREWARANYVPELRRPAIWHPIVLEEMRRLDVEQRVAKSDFSPNGSRYVPLSPGCSTGTDPHLNLWHVVS